MIEWTGSGYYLFAAVLNLIISLIGFLITADVVLELISKKPDIKGAWVIIGLMWFFAGIYAAFASRKHFRQHRALKNESN